MAALANLYQLFAISIITLFTDNGQEFGFHFN